MGSQSSGNRLRAAARLAAGSATGALQLRAAGGALLRVVAEPGKGRGLVAAEALRRGALVCRLPGRFVTTPPPRGAPCELFQVRAPRAGAAGCWLALAPPSAAAPGNAVNTADAPRDNNCRLTHRPGNAFVSLRATRDIARGERLLCAYGAPYTRRVRSAAAAAAQAAAAAPGPCAVVACAGCGARMQRMRLPAHARSFRCAARRAALAAARRRAAENAITVSRFSARLRAKRALLPGGAARGSAHRSA
jgi:hypothetical protein